MQANIIFLSLILLIVSVVGNSVPTLDEAVGTCSLQEGELLPDTPCYDNCKDTPDQRHFLTCIENTCFCRKAGPSHHHTDPIPPQQAAVPLNAGAVQESSIQNVTIAETNSTTTAATPTAEASSVSGSVVQEGNNATQVTPSSTNGTTTESAAAAATTSGAQVTPKS